MQVYYNKKEGCSKGKENFVALSFVEKNRGVYRPWEYNSKTKLYTEYDSENSLSRLISFGNKVVLYVDGDGGIEAYDQRAWKDFKFEIITTQEKYEVQIISD